MLPSPCDTWQPGSIKSLDAVEMVFDLLSGVSYGDAGSGVVDVSLVGLAGSTSSASSVILLAHTNDQSER